MENVKVKSTQKRNEEVMIRINQIKLPVTHDTAQLEQKIRKALKFTADTPFKYQIVKKSIDARKKPDLFYVYSVDVEIPNEQKIVKKVNDNNIMLTKVKKYVLPEVKNPSLTPVIAGAGPAGLFCAYALMLEGFRPVVAERGKKIDERTADVQKFWETGILNTASNVQFGEGGAGTFSDGKLNTLVKDKFGRNHFVLKEFVKHGAPEEILYEAKPHIGTDILKDVVASIRKEIESLGGEVHFRTKVCDILCEDVIKIDTDNAVFEQEAESDTQKKKIKGLILEKEGVQTKYFCHNVLFAIGHSARDTFYMLYKKELAMNPKAFAIGVRVEHSADLINESQYGEGYPKELPTASYKLTHQCKSTGRGIYSFCMCPGGYVVNSSSEKGRICVNGMSYHDRAGRNSNTALITTVTPDDFPSDSPLAGLEFQRKFEELAYNIGNGKIPVQLFGDFLKNQVSTKFGSVTPSIKGEWQFANLHECLPDYVCESLEEGMKAFGHKIKGYDAEDTVFSGVETRTSSPLRMERNREFESNIKGLFPCGEGAGYAGGITSAAMDGIKTAEAIAEKILE